MATNVLLDTPEVWRSVVRYRHRKRNPEMVGTYVLDAVLPSYLEAWEDVVHADVRGPYNDPGTARRMAGRVASALEAETARQTTRPGDTVLTRQIVSVTVERAALAWEAFDVRDPETGWGG
ncbi:hypothetical protein ACFV1L_10445 [Kitasatospora sp. NPDC059646]|uniref:hypothetical protein n=1 Tax=Kitasatospora sp. NPDC059646 TaxID=3346893 RepID=UPI003676CFF7